LELIHGEDKPRGNFSIPSIFPCYSDASLLLEWCFWSLKIEMLCWCYHHACWMLMMCLANARMLRIWCCNCATAPVPWRSLCAGNLFCISHDALNTCGNDLQRIISVFPQSLCAEPDAVC
jgi:hypothetical protein